MTDDRPDPTVTDPRAVPPYMRTHLHDGDPRARRAGMLDALDAFARAGHRLLDAWDDDAPTDGYPFESSFDETVTDLFNYRDTVAADPVPFLPCDHYGTPLRPGDRVAVTYAGGNEPRHLLARVHAVEPGGSGRVMLAIPSASWQPGAWDLDACEVVHVATVTDRGMGYDNLARVVAVEPDACMTPRVVGEHVTLLALAGDPEV